MRVALYVEGVFFFLFLSRVSSIIRQSLLGYVFWGFRSVRESFKNNKDKMEKYE